MDSPDITIIPGFVAHPDELFTFLCSSVEWDERMRARRTASIGVAYNYSGMTYSETPMLEQLVPVCAKIERLFGFYPNNCLLNFYADGLSNMGAHSDSVAQLAPDTGVAVLSLGESRVIRFCRKTDIRGGESCFDTPLLAGSLLFMSHAIQSDWLHSIPRQPGAGPRLSLSFRRVVA